MKLVSALLLGLVSLVQATENPFAGLQVKADTPKGMVYMDMAQVYGNGILEKTMKWWPKVYIQQSKSDELINPIFDKLTKDNVDTIMLEFAQIASIGQDLNQVHVVGHDLINMMIWKGQDIKGNVMPYSVGTDDTPETGINFLSYFTKAAKAKGFKLRLAIGGTAGDMDSYTMPGEPEESGKDLATFLNMYKFDEVEVQAQYQLGQYLMSNGANDIIKYFKAAKADFKGQIALCVANQLALGPEGELKLLFKSFDDIFDQLNMMFYTKVNYFLDADNVEFGIKQWQKYVSPSKMNIGFLETVNYSDKAASGGKKYDIPDGLSNGEAAAFIYSELNKDLAAIDPKMVPLGKVFFKRDNSLTWSADKFVGDMMNWTPSNSTAPISFLQ